MSIPIGLITLWSGAIVNIPAGWQLCDGTNGTPNLRDKFIVGAGTTYNPADSGGNIEHSHIFTANAHDHTISAGSGIGSGLEYSDTTDTAIVTGTTSTENHLPPYYALAYIMKI